MPEVIRTDVCVIGSGATGLMAAISARDLGAEVLVVSKSQLGKPSSTALAGGGFSGSGPDFSIEDHIEQTIRTGRQINEWKLVDKLAREFPAALEYAASKGALKLEYSQRGHYKVKVEPGFKGKQIPKGLPLVRGLANCVKKSGARTLEGFLVYDLVIRDGHCRGCWGISLEGREVIILARTTILATGGCGMAFIRTDNPRGISGDGYSMAARAGAVFRDMEFIQFHPLGLDEPGISSQTVYTPFPRETRFYNSAGENVLEKYFETGVNLTKAAIIYRDKLSISIMKEIAQGRTVYLDFTNVPAIEWQNSTTLQYLQTLRYDFKTSPAKVRPIVHFCCGGAVIDTECRTTVPGLYAAGEVTGGLHGANRLGGNALSECLVYGITAGRRAAEEALSSSQLAAEELPILHFGSSGSLSSGWRNIDPRALVLELRQGAWNYLGPVRSSEGLEACRILVERLRTHLDETGRNDPEHPRAWREFENMLLLIQMINEAALRRTESRGAHYRLDHPGTVDTWAQSQFLQVSNGTVNFCNSTGY